MSASGVLSGTSNFLCQKFVEKQEKVDFIRVAKFAGLISCLIAPIAYRWIHFIEKRIPATSLGNTTSGKLKVGVGRVILDQTIAAPILTFICIFSLNTLETWSTAAAYERTKTVYWTVLCKNWNLWPFVQLVNLTFVPLQYRIVLVQFVSVFWNIYLSYVQHQSKSAVSH
uniref:Mitochondrial inner membrane protein Mpv17 n=1 Tax=Panagrolaimus superbus TaxID=310955 RepID=A0A914XU41_9BILA